MKTKISLMILSMALSTAALAESQLDKAKRVNASAQKISGVDLTTYNCLITAISATKGKCQLTFVSNGKAAIFLASAEVAAIYAVSTKYAQAPRSDLTILVSSNEVLRIEDAAGETISKKIDYTK